MKKAGPLFFVICASVCAFAIHAVFLLPSILSLEATKTVIERRLGLFPGVTCKIGDIRCSWMEGLSISGLHLIGEPVGESTGTLLRINTCVLDLSAYDLVLRGRAGIRLLVNGVRLNLYRDATGKTNIDFLAGLQAADKPPANLPVEKKQVSRAPFVLPLDIGALIELSQVSVSMDDQVSHKRLLVENAELILHAASIRSRDVTLRLHTDVALNERKLPPVDLNLSAANIINPGTGMIVPETIDIKVDGNLPGATLSVSGRLAQGGLRSEVQIDLREIFEIVSPLAAPRIASSRLEGMLAVSAVSRLKATDLVAFDTAVTLDRVALSGPLLQGRSVSGLHLLLTNTGEMDLKGKILKITSGDLELLQRNAIRYHGHINLNSQTGQDSYLSLDTAGIDIGELLKFGRSFLPPDFPVQFGGEGDSPTLEINRASVRGDLFTGDCSGAVERLNLNVPSVRIDQKDMPVRARDITFRLHDLTTGLHRYFPGDIRFDSSLNVETVSLDAAQPIQVRKIAVPRFQFQIADIRKSPEALFGYAAEVSGKQQLTIGEIQLPPLAAVADIEQTLDGVCRLLPEHKVQVAVKEMSLGAADINVTHESVGKLQTRVAVNGTVPRVVIKSLQPFLLDISDFQSRIQVSDIAALGMTAEIRDSAMQKADTAGSLRINLGNLYQKLGKKPDLISLLDGTVRLQWQIHARRPTPSELSVLKKGMTSDLQNILPFIDEIRTDLSLDQCYADLAVNPNLDVRLQDITAAPLFAYQYEGKDGHGTFSGNITVESLQSKALPIQDNTVSARISFSGRHHGLNQVSLDQDLEIASFGLTESVNLTLSGLAESVFQNREKNLPYFLKKTGGSFSGKIDIQDMAVMCRLQKDLMAEGALQAGLQLLLVPGTRLGGNAWVHLSDIVLEQAGQFHVQDLAGDIRLEKEYLLAGNRADVFGADQSDTRTHLSNRVLQWNNYSKPQAPVPFSRDGQIGFVPYQTPYQEMMVRFASAESKGGPLPIRLQHFQTGLELVEGLPRIHNFQVDLLGGTMISSIAVQKTDNRFYIPVNVSFSGIQTERFWGITVREDQKKDTEVTGRFNAYIPLTNELNAFLTDLDVDVLFTHIGNMALEQLLYSLDPTESNEKIVSQRKLVEQGSPKWIQLTIKDGALSLEGVVTVKGVDIDIPQVRRLNISGLSGLDRIGEGLEKLTPLLMILQRMSANAIRMDQEKNAIDFFTAEPRPVASRENEITGGQRTIQ